MNLGVYCYEGQKLFMLLFENLPPTQGFEWCENYSKRQCEDLSSDNIEISSITRCKPTSLKPLSIYWHKMRLFYGKLFEI